jgi:hypothetical protein
VSKKFLARMSVKGALVAFAPTDAQVAFADSSSPAAVRLAARKLAEVVDVTGDSGLAFVEPLILKSGKWEPWKPAASPEVSSLAAATAEVNARGAANLVADLSDLAGTAGSYLAHTPAVDADAIDTVREWDAKTGSLVEVQEDDGGPQVLGRAATVRIGEHRASWNQFALMAGSKLVPARVDGTLVPEVFVLQSGFRWTASKTIAKY